MIFTPIQTQMDSKKYFHACNAMNTTPQTSYTKSRDVTSLPPLQESRPEIPEGKREEEHRFGLSSRTLRFSSRRG